MQNKKTIVGICWYKVFPAHTGGQKGIAHFYEALAKKEVITLLCSKNNTADYEFVKPILPISKWQIVNPFNLAKIKQYLKSINATHIIIEHPYYFFLANWCKKNDIKLIIHTHNIEYKRLQVLKKWYGKLVKWIEAKAYKKADTIWCKTVEDSNYIKNWLHINDNNIHIVPYGTSIKQSSVTKEAARAILQTSNSKKILMFAASFNYKPNIDGLKKLCSDIFTKLDESYEVWIFGKHLENYQYLKNDRIKIWGFVDDLTNYYTAADVIVNPVQEGAGIQTKTIEALTYNKPVITFTQMRNGLSHSLINENVFLADTVIDFSIKIEAAFTNRNIETNNDFVKNNSWSNIVENLKY